VAFREQWTEADGFRIRYMEAGEGPPLVHLQGAGGMRLNPSHDLLAKRFRVVVFEMPGFGTEENTRTRDIADLAATMGKACIGLGLQQVNLMGTSFGARVVLHMAIQHPELVRAVVLEAPAAIRPEGTQPPSGTPEQIAQMIYAHPERMPPRPPVDPAHAEQMLTFVKRLRGPARDSKLETAMGELKPPVLVVMGSRDRLMPPKLGRLYKEVMPHAHLVFVYDAGHAIGSERPEAFVEVVGDFLEREDAFVISRAKTVLLP
jgi:pimeloyl-ACP methyl ester carboxylesterase